jgi:mRNA interferase RelE/StbE
MRVISYTIEFDKKFIKHLRKINQDDRDRISKWIKKNLNDTADPRQHGKILTGGLAGYWRYRVGQYRIIAEIRDNELILLMIDVGHRRDIYR